MDYVPIFDKYCPFRYHSIVVIVVLVTNPNYKNGKNQLVVYNVMVTGNIRRDSWDDLSVVCDIAEVQSWVHDDGWLWLARIVTWLIVNNGDMAVSQNRGQRKSSTFNVFLNIYKNKS